MVAPLADGKDGEGKLVVLVVPVLAHLPVALHQATHLGFGKVFTKNVHQNVLAILEKNSSIWQISFRENKIKSGD